ncbi:hypothetical protein WN51_13006 [Melipona quadrifasciata]|uniref:Uncharacterized protein n=1 Tax=Melipona quadrifasciata TaxID=166423 RepID=A0A0N0BKH8_9HYME|nr:hypothetical protein WN51_13006 [Melipona quadrifasciata]
MEARRYVFRQRNTFSSSLQYPFSRQPEWAGRERQKERQGGREGGERRAEEVGAVGWSSQTGYLCVEVAFCTCVTPPVVSAHGYAASATYGRSSERRLQVSCQRDAWKMAAGKLGASATRCRPQICGGFRFDVGGQTGQKHHREKNQAADQETAGRDKETKSGLTPATFEIEAALYLKCSRVLIRTKSTEMKVPSLQNFAGLPSGEKFRYFYSDRCDLRLCTSVLLEPKQMAGLFTSSETVKSSGDQRDKQSIKSTNSPALNKFLDDVLKAQNDLRWIDQTVQSVNREKKRRKEVHLFPAYDDKEATDDQIPKDWSKPKDLCSLSDWLNSDKNPRNEQDKSGDRWIHGYEVDQKDALNLDGESSPKADARDQRRNEPKKGDAPSLESLKETILELKKSLNEGGKEQRGNSKSADASSAEEEEQREPRDKHRKDVNDEVETTRPDNVFAATLSLFSPNSAWRDVTLNLRKREQKPEDADEKNARPKENAWRTKRAEVNNDDDVNPRLLRRAGFGAPYPRQSSLKEPRDRKRRSKEASEKRLNDEAQGENNSATDEKNSMENSSKVGDGERSSLSLENLNRLTEEGRNSLGTFESRKKMAASNRESIGSSKGASEAIKVFEPRRMNGEENERSEGQGRRLSKDSGNVDILLESENKNLVKFSNQAGEGTRDNSQADGDRPPFAFNVLGVRKETLVEKEEKGGSSVSTVVDVKVEKARVDTPVQGACQRGGSERSEGDEREVPVGGEVPVLDFRTGKVEEDTPATSRVTRVRNEADEKRLKNSARVDKGPGQSGGNWLGASEARDRMAVNVDQTAAEKCNDPGGKDEFTRGEERFGDNKEKGFPNSGVRGVGPNGANGENEEGRNKKYKEIFVMTNGMDDGVTSDRYGQRRMLQYMEYSNDDVEDADASYSDKEEEESQREASAEKSDAPSRRKERSAYTDKKKAKVNLLIKEKLKKKKKPTERERRNPSVIEYYDYDDLDQQDRESSSEQERVKNNYQDENIIDSYAGHAVEPASNQKCCPQSTEKIKDEQEEAMQKEIKRKEKFQHKKPQQQFLSPAADTRNATSKLPTRSTKVAEEGGSSGNGRSGSRLNEPVGGNEDKFLDSDTNEVVPDPEKYLLKMDANLDVIDDFFDDIQYLDQKKEKVSDSVKPLYEELKKVYDWNEDESRKSKPRIKGDQRMYHESNDKSNECSTEPSKNQTDPAEVRDGPTETSASSPNLLPLLLVRAGSGKSEIGERIYQSVSSGEREGPAAAAATAASANVSQSNYFALKSTDDMFKGGPEQGNSTGEKLRGPGRAIETGREWQTQKVSGVRNDGAKGRDAVSWSLTDRGQYIDTDSQRSPCGDRKYPERERVQNIDREKQTIVSSRDLHESFVEPVEWFDDFDKDARVRLARGLKTVDADALVPPPGSAATKYEGSLVNGSIDGARETGNGTSLKTEDSPALVGYSRSSLGFAPLSDGDSRVKREIASPYDTYREDGDRYNRDYEETEDDPDDLDLQFFNSYEDSYADEENLERRDYSEDDHGDDYEENVDSKRKAARVGKKRREKASKKRRKKGRVGKSSESREKRRHRKKHSNGSKSHKREESASRSGSRRSVKKSKVTQNEGESRSEEAEDRDDVDGEDTTNADTDSQRERFTALLITTDDTEDESQMDSALRGELAGEIVQQIFDQVQRNEELKVSLGPGLYRKHKDTAAAEKSYGETLNDDDIRNTKELLNRITLLLNRLIFDEVQRKTCISLPSDLIEFLHWMLQVDTQANSLEQPPALPLVHEEDQDHFRRDKFLFQSFPNDRVDAEINELYAKIELIKSLIKEYNALTDKDKAKIESIQEYLAKQLDLLLEYIEARKEAEKNGKTGSGAAKGKSGGIRRYQTGTSNASNASYSTRPDSFSPLTNALPNLSTGQLFQENGIGVPRRGERVTRSVDKRARYNETRRKRKKRGKKHRERHKGARPATREKREYLDKAFWDSLDSGYEEPLIYHSMDMTSVESSANGESESKREERLEDAGGKNAGSWSNNLEEDNVVDQKEGARTEGDASRASDVQSKEQNNFNEESKDPIDEEEPITGKNRVEDEILLLNKRQAWIKENERQLEEVAFGEDMRKASRDKELFEKLTDIDKRKNDRVTRNSGVKNYTTENPNGSGCNLSDDDKLRMLEEKINVYADNERGEQREAKSERGGESYENEAKKLTSSPRTNYPR